MVPQENQKKGEWSPQEDQKLYGRVTGSGTRNWTQISKDAGLLRSGKSCRLRWMNYLRPDLKRGRFTIEEIELILHYHQLLGNKWSMIASYLPGRTDNAIKNFYHTYIRKRLKSGKVIKSNTPQKDLNKNKQKRKLMMSSTSSSGSEELSSFPILESYALKEDHSSCVLIDGSGESSSISLPESNQDGVTHEEGWIDQNIFGELFRLEDEFMHGMKSIPFGYDEFSSWENMTFPETSPYEYCTLLSTHDFD